MVRVREHPADLSQALPRPTLRDHAGDDSHREYRGGGLGNADRGIGSERRQRRPALDGVIQHSSDDDDFPYSDWSAPYRTPAGRDAVLAVYGESFDLLLGRRTYDMWSGFWPNAPRGPMSDRLNAAKKYVATHRPESL